MTPPLGGVASFAYCVLLARVFVRCTRTLLLLLRRSLPRSHNAIRTLRITRELRFAFRHRRHRRQALPSGLLGLDVLAWARRHAKDFAFAVWVIHLLLSPLLW